MILDSIITFDVKRWCWSCSWPFPAGALSDKLKTSLRRQQRNSNRRRRVKMYHWQKIRCSFVSLSVWVKRRIKVHTFQFQQSRLFPSRKRHFRTRLFFIRLWLLLFVKFPVLPWQIIFFKGMRNYYVNPDIDGTFPIDRTPFKIKVQVFRKGLIPTFSIKVITAGPTKRGISSRVQGQPTRKKDPISPESTEVFFFLIFFFFYTT